MVCAFLCVDKSLLPLGASVWHQPCNEEQNSLIAGDGVKDLGALAATEGLETCQTILILAGRWLGTSATTMYGFVFS